MTHILHRHRISAGALVEREGRLLMVRHVIPGQYDFWVAPGDGVKGSESYEEAAAEHVIEAAWLCPGELQGRVAFPSVNGQRFASDQALGFPAPVRLPLRAMAFW